MNKIKNLNNLRDSVFRKECGNNNLDRVKDLIKRDTELTLNLKRGVLMACVKGSLSVLKYLLETPNIKERIDLNAEAEEFKSRSFSNNALIEAYMNCQSEIVDYLIFEVNIDITEQTKKSLKFSGEKDLLNKIEKKELFIEMKAQIKNENKDTPKIKI